MKYHISRTRSRSIDLCDNMLWHSYTLCRTHTALMSCSHTLITEFFCIVPISFHFFSSVHSVRHLSFKGLRTWTTVEIRSEAGQGISCMLSVFDPPSYLCCWWSKLRQRGSEQVSIGSMDFTVGWVITGWLWFNEWLPKSLWSVFIYVIMLTVIKS